MTSIGSTSSVQTRVMLVDQQSNALNTEQVPSAAFTPAQQISHRPRLPSAKSLFLGHNHGVLQEDRNNIEEGNHLNQSSSPTKQSHSVNRNRHALYQENNQEPGNSPQNKSNTLKSSIVSFFKPTMTARATSGISVESGLSSYHSSHYSSHQPSTASSMKSTQDYYGKTAAINAKKAANASSSGGGSESTTDTINNDEDDHNYMEEYTHSYLFNFVHILKTNELTLEYSKYSIQQRSLIVALVYAAFFTFTFILSCIATFTLSKSHRYYQIVFGFSTASYIFSFMVSLLGWLIFYRQTKSGSNSKSAFAKWLQFHSVKIQYLMLMFMTLAYCARMIGRTISGPCENVGVERGGPLLEWNCNPYHSVEALPVDTMVAMMFTPIAYPAIFRECRLDIVLLSFWVNVIILIVASYLLQSIQPLYLIGSYIFMCLFVAIDCPRQSLNAFLEHKKFQKASIENAKMAQQTEVEMRHVLGNVAHDFKTPLSSFMNGVDVIANTIEDFETIVCRLHEKEQNASIAFDEVHDLQTMSVLSTLFDKEFQSFLKSIKMTLHDVRSTNSFMLMTINRCLDFTKASKGMKLSPKYETVDLIETIAMPINCMKNIQNKVSVRLTNISGLICSHIITDKQWLQENILCLLSNAVKYSSEGEVGISISLQKYRTGNTPEEDEMPKMKLIAVPKGSNPKLVDDHMIIEETSPFSSSSTLTKPLSSSNNANGRSRFSETIQSVLKFVGVSASSKSSTKGNDTKIVPVTTLQQYDHYLVPQEVNADDMSVHVKTHRSTASSVKSGNANSSRRVPPPASTFTQPDRGFILIEIEDHGIGISDQAMKELFSPFKQTQRLAGGTGLGLFSLAKRIEAMHGSYGVKKRKDGAKGSLFWFSFPYRPDMVLAKSHGDGYAQARMHEIDSPPVFLLASKSKSQDDHDPRKKSNDSTDSKNGGAKVRPLINPKREKSGMLRSESVSGKHKAGAGGGNGMRSLRVGPAPSDNSTPAANATGTTTVTTTTKAKLFDILVAEDSPTISKMVKMMLTRQGHKVTIAENGEVVLKRIKERIESQSTGFDVILMDLQMPVMDGLEATRRLRQLEEEHALLSMSSNSPPAVTFKIIGLSANSEEDTTQQAFDAGIDSFLPKPFDIISFYTIMEGLEEDD